MLDHLCKNDCKYRCVQNRTVIEEDDIFTALEDIQNEKHGSMPMLMDVVEENDVTRLVRRTLSVYYCAKALVATLVPHFDQVQKACPPFQCVGVDAAQWGLLCLHPGV